MFIVVFHVLELSRLSRCDNGVTGSLGTSCSGLEFPVASAGLANAAYYFQGSPTNFYIFLTLCIWYPDTLFNPLTRLWKYGDIQRGGRSS